MTKFKVITNSIGDGNPYSFETYELYKKGIFGWKYLGSSTSKKDLERRIDRIQHPEKYIKVDYY